MGFLTFGQIQNRISMNLSSRISDTAEIRRVAHLGVLDMVGRLKLEEFRVIDVFPIVAGTDVYAFPANSLGVRTIWVDGRMLTLASRLPISTTPGRPARYIRTSLGIQIHPIPDVDYDGKIEHVIEPTLLADASFLPTNSLLDIAAIQFGTYYGLLSLGENKVAFDWMNAGVEYIKEHNQTWNVQQDAVRGGLQVARSWDDLREDMEHDEGS